MNPLLLFGGSMVAAYAALVAIALRRPLLARIAVREALRRPWQSALLIAGLMMATAAVLAAQVLEGSVFDSVAAGAYQAWGRVDLRIAAQDGAVFSPSIATALAGQSEVQRSASGVQGGQEWIGSTADVDSGRTRPFTRLIGFDPATQPAFGSFTLTNGSTTVGNDLSVGQVIISRSLRDALGARIGDRLQVSVAVNQGGVDSRARQVTVAGIAEPIGPGAYGLRPSLFAPLGTMSSLSGSDGINVIRVSARGSGSEELAASDELAPVVRQALSRIPGAAGLVVEEGKRGDVEAALNGQDPGALGQVGFTYVLSAVVVIAAVGLVINLMVTLVEERRPRLGVLRAIGLSRLGAVEALAIEGGIYTLLAGVVGCLPGLLFGWVLYRTAAASGSGTAGSGGSGVAVGRDLQAIFSVRPTAVATSIAVGTVITLFIVVLTAARNSRMTIAAAIRDLPEPPANPNGIRRNLAATALVLLSLSALFVPAVWLHILGGTGLISAAALLTRGLLPNSARIGAAGLSIAVWSLIGYAIGLETTNGSAAGEILAVATPLIIFGLALAIAANLRLLETILTAGRSLIRLRALVRPMLAFMTRRPVRAGLTVGTFGLVLSVIVVYNALIAAYGATSRQAHARIPYDIRVFAPAASALVLPPAVQDEIASSLSIPTRTYLGPIKIEPRPGAPATWHQEYLSLYEFSPEQEKVLEAGGMTNRLPQFADDAAAWRTLEQDSGWVIWTRFNTNATVVLQGASGPVTRRVAADAGDPILDGIIGSPQALAPFANRPLGTTLLLRTRPGVDPDRVARQIQESLLGQGVGVTTVKQLLQEWYGGFLRFASVPDMFMRLGLVVGILSLGVLALRAIIDRRRVIGVLRALGYTQREMLGVVLGEATVTTSAGALIGVVAGSIAAYIYVRLTVESVRFGLDALSLVSALALMYAAVLIATIGPALSAARMPPAQALRLLE